MFTAGLAGGVKIDNPQHNNQQRKNMNTKVKAKKITIDGEAMLALRKKLNLNQQQFWAHLGVTQSGGSRYESGQNIPLPTRKLIYLLHFAKPALDPVQQATLEAIR